jgi:hypothetical protein
MNKRSRGAEQFIVTQNLEIILLPFSLQQTLCSPQLMVVQLHIVQLYDIAEVISIQ